MTYQRLDAGGLQWPCPAEDHPGTALLHAETFASGPRASLLPVNAGRRRSACPRASCSLITGRSLYQFNAGTMTGRTPDNELRPTDTLDISPGDADDLGILDGDPVRVVSAYGAATVPARLSGACSPATCSRPSIGRMCS